TGLATGPHLDYRMVKSGVFVNPLKIQSPPAEPIAAGERDAFQAACQSQLALLDPAPAGPALASAPSIPAAPPPYAARPAMLMVLGASMLVGGWRRKELRFSRLAAETGSSMMVLAVVALVIPAIYAEVTHHTQPEHTEAISFDISCVLIACYAASLVFSLKTHQHLFAGEGVDDEVAPGGRPWPMATSLGVLFGSALLVGWVSEYLVHAVGAAGEALGLRKIFMGVVVIALV